MADPVPVSTTPQPVRPVVDWARITQLAGVLGILLTGVVNTYQQSGGQKPVDPNAPVPPPVVTPLEQTEKRLTDLVNKRFDEVSEQLSAPKPKK